MLNFKTVIYNIVLRIKKTQFSFIEKAKTVFSFCQKNRGVKQAQFNRGFSRFIEKK